MSAAYIVEHCPTRESWIETRRSYIGGSDAPYVCGKKGGPSRLQIWLEKIGKESSRNDTEEMTWGKRLEPLIAQAYTERTDVAFQGLQVCARSIQRPWQGATFDGIRTDGRPVQFKALSEWPGRQIKEDDLNTVPENMMIQVQHEISVADVDVGYLAVFVPLKLLIFEIPRCQCLIDAIINVEREFAECIRTKVPPPSRQIGDSEELLRYTGVMNRSVELGYEDCISADIYLSSNNQIRESAILKSEKKDLLIRHMNGASLGLLPDGREVHIGMAQIKSRTTVVSAHSQVRLTIKETIA